MPDEVDALAKVLPNPMTYPGRSHSVDGRRITTKTISDSSDRVPNRIVPQGHHLVGGIQDVSRRATGWSLLLPR